MSEDSHAIVPYSEKILDAENLTNILKRIGLLKTEAKKSKDEYGCWHTLISDSVKEMIQSLRTTCNTKIIQHLTFVRFFIEFERATMHDIANLTILPSK